MAPEFILLEDFTSAYDVFPLKVLDIDGALTSAVVQPMREALRSCAPTLRPCGDAVIEHAVRPTLAGSAFVVTMDGGSYFKPFDFSFEITRAAYKIGDLAQGPYFRLPREARPQLIQQGIRLRQRYEEAGAGKPIVVCDDGIGTGRSLESIIDIFHDLQLEVQRIVVLLNPHRLTSIRGVEVKALLPCPRDALWLSERDLYWGLPRSGVSFTRPYEVHPRYGVPYTIDARLVESRIGFDHETAVRFRAKCLDLNVRFWEYLEQQHNRPLYFEDCSRLRFIEEDFERKEVRIADFLREIATPDFDLATFAQP